MSLAVKQSKNIMLNFMCIAYSPIILIMHLKAREHQTIYIQHEKVVELSVLILHFLLLEEFLQAAHHPGVIDP